VQLGASTSEGTTVASIHLENDIPMAHRALQTTMTADDARLRPIAEEVRGRLAAALEKLPS
jgi:hypothetical protein